ncbi:hypothetical protein TUM4438_18300 [Shewanella sairae]|uniref:Uncharacterized protein n=1 Tax=Shewanella sairae TaxID=190310 RepID=A0ABQ4PCS5_9GAMM|nr:hypothetical protein [Shewanella sairae]MCL1130923.1 hypothetical protein [Shewanella sairae]GIU45249.1 hypothetical protein TUM4438_18300 [Shewanella sairae]
MQTVYRKQSGQALIESVLGLSYVIIPLLIIMPFMSKVSGLQHKSHQASHYLAWERTVWKEQDPSLLPNVSGLYIAKKSETENAKQLPWRFYQKDGLALNSRNTNQWNWNNIHPLLKHQTQRNHSQTTLLKPVQQSSASVDEELSRFTRTHNGERLPGSMGGIVENAVNLLSLTGFSLEQDQFYRTGINTNIENHYLEPFNNLNLNLNGNSALLASGWNAAGPHHVKNRVERLVLTNYMNIAPIQTAQSILGILPFGKELRPNSLRLGHVDPNILPTNRLCTYGTANCGG